MNQRLISSLKLTPTQSKPISFYVNCSLFDFSSDDDVAPVEIVIPKRKEEIEAERVSEAKKAFAKQLAQMYATMKNDSSRYLYCFIEN